VDFLDTISIMVESNGLRTCDETVQQAKKNTVLIPTPKSGAMPARGFAQN